MLISTPKGVAPLGLVAFFLEHEINAQRRSNSTHFPPYSILPIKSAIQAVDNTGPDNAPYCSLIMQAVISCIDPLLLGKQEAEASSIATRSRGEGISALVIGFLHILAAAAHSLRWINRPMR